MPHCLLASCIKRWIAFVLFPPGLAESTSVAMATEMVNDFLHSHSYTQQKDDEDESRIIAVCLSDSARHLASGLYCVHRYPMPCVVVYQSFVNLAYLARDVSARVCAFVDNRSPRTLLPDRKRSAHAGWSSDCSLRVIPWVSYMLSCRQRITRFITGSSLFPTNAAMDTCSTIGTCPLDHPYRFIRDQEGHTDEWPCRLANTVPMARTD